MQAGKLRHRIKFETLTDSQGTTFGEALQTPVLFKEVWSSIEPISGREIIQADQAASGLTHRVRIRYLQGISEKMRINYFDHRASTNRYFGIVSIIDKEERHIEMELLCMEEK